MENVDGDTLSNSVHWGVLLRQSKRKFRNKEDLFVQSVKTRKW